MKQWSVADAKAQFSTVLHEAEAEPQMICRRDHPVAVVLSMPTYEKATKKKGQSVSQMLRRLREIQEQEQAEIEAPPRVDRPAVGLED